MSDHGSSGRSVVGVLEFVAKLAAIFSLFVVVGSVLGTGAPNMIALAVCTVSILLILVFQYLSKRE